MRNDRFFSFRHTKLLLVLTRAEEPDERGYSGLHEAIEERLCTKCTEKVVEDESHYLAHCATYNALRSKYGYVDKNPVQIMSDINQSKLAIYSSKCFDLQKEITELN